MSPEEQVKDLRKVFTSLSVVSPFSYPILTIPIVFKTDFNSPIGTNGSSIFCNYDKWSKLSFKQKMFESMHIWLHIALQHAKRMHGRQRKVWNTACEFVCSDIIVSDLKGKFEPPPGVYYDKAFSNKSVEQVYSLLLEKMKENNNPENNPQITSGQQAAAMLSSGAGPDDLFQQQASVNENQLIDAVIKAAIRTKSMKRGRVPGRYLEYIETLKKSTIPWQRLLFSFARKILKGTTDRNPFKPDPKYLPFDVIIPTEQTNRLSKLVFIVDTSASMKREEFEKVCGHLERLGTLVDKCFVITADTKVQEVVRVKRIKTTLKNKKLQFKGRSGTDMTEAFQMADKMNPDLIILYSDMMIGKWPDKPRAKVMFLATEDSYVDKAPYGIFIRVKENEN